MKCDECGGDAGTEMCLCQNVRGEQEAAMVRWYRGIATDEDRAQLMVAKLVMRGAYGHQRATARGVNLMDTIIARTGDDTPQVAHRINIATAQYEPERWP